MTTTTRLLCRAPAPSTAIQTCSLCLGLALALSARTASASPAEQAAQQEPAATQKAHAAATAASRPASKPAQKPQSHADALRAAGEQLDAADVEQVRQGLRAIAEQHDSAAARVLDARIRRGLPPAVIDDAIDAAVLLGSPQLGPALLELTLHKRAAVREHALSAIAALKVKNAEPTLLAALNDPSAEVRATASRALGDIGDAHDALPSLFVLVDRGEPAALAAVAKLAGPRDLPSVLARAPNGDLSQVEPVLEAMMSRERVRLGDKLQLVARVSRIGSASARNCLVQWLDASTSDGPARVRKALFDAIKHIDDQNPALADKTVVQHLQLAQGEAAAANGAKP